MQRIEYIDNIKGFAILLVVMGHVIANWFYDFYAVHDNDPDNQLMVWKLIYSFHMPLFMFCSGLFQPIINMEDGLGAVWDIIVRRFKVLIIPYFASGLLLWQVTGRLQFYWYLLILFEFVVLTTIIECASVKLGKHRNKLELLGIFLLYVFFRLLGKYGAGYEQLPLLDIGHLSLYPYFATGYIVMKYHLPDRILSNMGYTVSIVVFGLYATLTCLMAQEIKIPGFGFVGIFAAIYAVFYLFRNMNSGRSTIVMNWLGRHSLEIYILHFFFLVKVPFVGNFIHESARVGGVAYCS